MTTPDSAAVVTPPAASLRSTLVWTAASIGVTLVFVLLTPRLGMACGVLLSLAGLVAWSLHRPELLVIGTMAAAMLGSFGQVLSAGSATVTVYQAVFVAALLAYGWLLLEGRERLPRPTPANLWLGVSLLLLLAGAFAALPAAQSLAGAVAAFLALGSSVVLVFLVVGVCSTPARLRAALVAFVLLVALFGVFAVLERFQVFSFQPYYKTVVDGIRARTTFKDPNIFGGVLAAGAAAGIPLAAAERRWLHAALLWGAVAVALVGVVATLSRGALLGFLVGAVVAVVVAPMRPLLRLSLVVLGLAGVTLLFVVVLDPGWVAAKITGISSNSSALYRIYLAESGVRMFQARPFGFGPGNWENAILAYRDTRVPAALLASHTTYFTVLVEAGILGLVGIVAGVAIYIWVTVKAVARAACTEVRTLAASSLAGGAVLLVQSLTYSLETSKFLWFMVGAGVAAAALRRSKEDEEAS